MANAVNCRNFVIAGHAGSGKTTFCEQLLRKGGAIQRIGSIDAKNTVSDYMSDEQCASLLDKLDRLEQSKKPARKAQ